MKKVLASLVLAIVLLVSPVSASSVWTPIAETLLKSVVVIGISGRDICSGFVIHSEPKPGKDYILTAGHCDGTDLLADRMPARTVSKDVKKDLLVLEVEDTGRPALRLAKQNPKIGEEVASLGYGYALERPLFRVTHISDDNTYIPEEGIGGPFLITDTTFVPGQSGGPVVNQAGQVVMIVQMGDRASLGIGIGAEVIKSRVGKYFEPTKAPEKK